MHISISIYRFTNIDERIFNICKPIINHSKEGANMFIYIHIHIYIYLCVCVCVCVCV